MTEAFVMPTAEEIMDGVKESKRLRREARKELNIPSWGKYIRDNFGPCRCGSTDIEMAGRADLVCNACGMTIQSYD